MFNNFHEKCLENKLCRESGPMKCSDYQMPPRNVTVKFAAILLVLGLIAATYLISDSVAGLLVEAIRQPTRY